MGFFTSRCIFVANTEVSGKFEHNQGDVVFILNEKGAHQPIKHLFLRFQVVPASSFL